MVEPFQLLFPQALQACHLSPLFLSFSNRLSAGEEFFSEFFRSLLEDSGNFREDRAASSPPKAPLNSSEPEAELQAGSLPE